LAGLWRAALGAAHGLHRHERRFNGSTVIEPDGHPFQLEQTDALLSTTRAVRRRLDLDRPVAPALIAECLELAQQAPIASNEEVRRWVVVTDPALKDAIADLYRAAALPYLDGALRDAHDAGDTQQERVVRSALFLAHNLQRVPVHVIPCREPDVDLSSQAAAAAAYGSVIPAVWSFQLALRSRGLGSAWTTLHLDHEAEVGRMLGIPSSVTQVALLPVAYTVGTEFRPAHRTPSAEVTYWNRWLSTDPPEAA
jgi:nitroreductase